MATWPSALSPKRSNPEDPLQTNRTHLERITALAHARQAATFHPELVAPPEKEKTEKKIRRRVSLGVAVDAETGEVTSLGLDTMDEVESTSVALGRRHSTRTHTVANTSATVSRVKDEERKVRSVFPQQLSRTDVPLQQSSAPKRAKFKNKALTQAELIARALDMEEGNTEEHKNYLTIEEEKRRKARVVRASVQGPLLRWTSKTEEITVRIDPAPPPVVHAQYPPPYGGAPGYSYVPPQYIPPQQTSPSIPQSPFQQWPPPPPPAMYQTESAPQPYVPQPYVPSPPPQPIFRKEKAAKQYVVHELEQVEKAPRPTWSSTMTAMFGGHADWENMRVYTTKGRPFGTLTTHVLIRKRFNPVRSVRPTQGCAILPKQRVCAFPRGHIPHQLQVTGRARVNQHRALDLGVPNEQRVGHVSGVEPQFCVLEQGTRSGEGVISDTS